MASSSKITKKQAEVAARAKDFPIILSSGGGYLFSDGRAVNAKTVNSLLSKGLLRASEDGLFDGFSQTLHAA